MSPDDLRHGTMPGRHAHTKDGEPTCEPCRRAAARYEQELVLDRLSGRPRRIPAIGTRRRVQALVALGYNFRQIGEALEIGQQGASRIAHCPYGWVYAKTATRVALIFEAWSMRLPSEETTAERRGAAYARTNARRNGWLPPLAWDDIDNDSEPATGGDDEVVDVDEMAVQRRLAGDLVPITKPERIEVVRIARGLGWSYLDIERRTGINKPERYIAREDAVA